MITMRLKCLIGFHTWLDITDKYGNTVEKYCADCKKTMHNIKEVN